MIILYFALIKLTENLLCFRYHSKYSNVTEQRSTSLSHKTYTREVGKHTARCTEEVVLDAQPHQRAHTAEKTSFTEQRNTRTTPQEALRKRRGLRIQNCYKTPKMSSLKQKGIKACK